MLNTTPEFMWGLRVQQVFTSVKPVSCFLFKNLKITVKFIYLVTLWDVYEGQRTVSED